MAEHGVQGELSPEQAARFARQIMLGDLGREGQAALLEATARVGGSEMGELYALRAGFSGVAPGDVDVDALAPREVLRTQSARTLLAGARAALGEVRRVLEERRG